MNNTPKLTDGSIESLLGLVGIVRVTDIEWATWNAHS